MPHSRRRRRGLWVAALLVLLTATGCSRAGDEDPAPSATAVAPTPEPARDFSLTTLDGATVSLADLRGQWVVLNFWATWCPPCVQEMPYLNQLAAARELQVLGVNFNEDDHAVRTFVVDHGITFPILMDPDDITLLVYGVRALPRTFVIDPDGMVVHTLFGQIDPAQFDAWLDAHGVPQRQSRRVPATVSDHMPLRAARK